jgi:hypothetical protein
MRQPMNMNIWALLLHNFYNFFGFYLPHMEYEGSFDYATEKMIFFAYFHVLRLFMAKNYDLSENYIFVCHAPGPLNAKFA